MCNFLLVATMPPKKLLQELGSVSERNSHFRADLKASAHSRYYGPWRDDYGSASTDLTIIRSAASRDAIPDIIGQLRSLDGIWSGAIIEGDWMEFLSSTATPQKITRTSALSFTLQVEDESGQPGWSCTAELRGDGKLHWDGGGVWHRCDGRFDSDDEGVFSVCAETEVIHFPDGPVEVGIAKVMSTSSMRERAVKNLNDSSAI